MCYLPDSLGLGDITHVEAEDENKKGAYRDDSGYGFKGYSKNLG